MSITKTQKVFLCRQTSDSPEIIEYAEVESPQITGPHDIIIKNKYAGVNFINAYFRKGVYPTEFPHIFGKEAAGVVVAVGDDVMDYKVGDKYKKLTDKAVQITKLPEDTTDEGLKKWAAILLQGLTAITLSIEPYEVQKGDFILIWAAAGGVGQILTQFTSSLGARVIAIASPDEKLQIAGRTASNFCLGQTKTFPQEWPR